MPPSSRAARNASRFLFASLDRVLAPLEVAGRSKFADRLNPVVTIDDRQFVLIAQELVTVRKSVRGGTRFAWSRARSHHRGARHAVRRTLFLQAFRDQPCGCGLDLILQPSENRVPIDTRRNRVEDLHPHSAGKAQ